MSVRETGDVAAVRRPTEDLAAENARLAELLKERDATIARQRAEIEHLRQLIESVDPSLASRFRSEWETPRSSLGSILSSEGDAAESSASRSVSWAIAEESSQPPSPLSSSFDSTCGSLDGSVLPSTPPVVATKPNFGRVRHKRSHSESYRGRVHPFVERQNSGQRRSSDTPPVPATKAARVREVPALGPALELAIRRIVESGAGNRAHARKAVGPSSLLTSASDDDLGTLREGEGDGEGMSLPGATGAARKPGRRRGTSNLQHAGLLGNPVVYDQYVISADIEELTRAAMIRKYEGSRYAEAAVVIQNCYRRYKLRSQFKQKVRLGLSFNSPWRGGLKAPYKHSESLDSSTLLSNKTTGIPIIVTEEGVEGTPPASGVADGATQGTSSPTSAMSPSPAQASEGQGAAQADTHAAGETHGPDSPQSEEWVRRRLRFGVHRFNRDPMKGMAYLLQHRILPSSPDAVAEFLHVQPGLSKRMVGDFLGDGAPFSIAVLERYSKRMGFAGMELDAALRQYLSSFRLPGEAQKIDRMMEHFANRYCECNPGVFASPDTAYVLAFSIVMLNTDLHNPSVKRKMSKDDFVRNNRGIDNNRDLPRSYLESIYDRILEHEIEPGRDHVWEVERIAADIRGKFAPLSVPHRRFVRSLSAVEVLDANTKPSKGKHLRTLFLFNDLVVITKVSKRDTLTLRGASSAKVASLTENIFRVSMPVYGMRVQDLESKYHKNAFILSDYNDVHVLAFAVDDEAAKNAFLAELEAAIVETTELEEERLGEMEHIMGTGAHQSSSGASEPKRSRVGSFSPSSKRRKSIAFPSPSPEGRARRLSFALRGDKPALSPSSSAASEDGLPLPAMVPPQRSSTETTLSPRPSSATRVLESQGRSRSSTWTPSAWR